jgi:putative tryptophan/tyrosine transport system substrate-binding protein
MDEAMKRRDLITAFGAAAVWPAAARAQQPAMPVIGFLASLSSAYVAHFAPAFRRGLSETDYIDGQNVVIEFRAAEGKYDRLAGLAAELLDRKVAVIVAIGGSEPAKVAKAATATIPIVFVSAADPIRAGVVTSFNRPGGNITGVSLLGSALEAKRLELLHEMIPGASPIGVLLNPKYPDFEIELHDLQDAADVIKRKILVARASTETEIDAAFATVTQQGASALLVAQDPFFNSQREHLVAVATQFKLPVIYGQREHAEVGGLFSYGTSFAEGYHQAGVYVGKILKGAKPSDLPILQPTKYELVINLRTARTLGVAVPSSLLALADEVIE